MARQVRHFEQFPIDTPRLRVQGLGVREVMPPCYTYRPQGWEHFLFVLFHTRADCQTNEERVPVEAGTLICWRPSTRHGMGCPTAGWDHSWLSVGGTDVARALRKSRFPLETPVTLHDLSFTDTALSELFEELHRSTTGSDCLNPTLIRNYVVNFILRLARGTQQPERPMVPKPLTELRAYIQSSFHRRLTLTSMANRAGLSVSQLCLLHKKHFGVSIMDYVRHVRMQYAARLLHSSDLKVRAVASLCGYSDHFHFSKSFKHRFGSPPGAYKVRTSMNDTKPA